MAAARHTDYALALEGALRAIRSLTAANEKLVGSASEPEFLRAVCRVVVDQGGYLMAWVGFAEHGPDKAVRPVCQYGYEAGYLASADITWADTERGQGPSGRAIRTGRAQVNQNLLTNPAMAPWRNAARERGYQSSIGLPLKGELGTFGALAIYAREPDAFGEKEVTLLMKLASELASAIITLRTKTEGARTAEQTRQYESRVRQGLEETIEAVSAALNMHDAYTDGHQKRVGALAAAIANEMKLPENDVYGIKVAALVHDIGKIRVPAAILMKSGKLTQSEVRLVQDHARTGREILMGITFPWSIADIVWQHHEKPDGSGYPRGLRGDEILLGARIIAVANVMDGLTSARPYRAALDFDAAIHRIVEGRGTSFDTGVVDAFTRSVRDGKFAFPA